MARISIIDSTSTIQAKILFALKKKVQKSFRRASGPIRDKVRTLVVRQVAQSPTTASLLKGKLQADFGLTSSFADAAVLAILTAVSNNIDVSLQDNKTTSGVGSIVVRILPLDITTFTDIPFSTYNSNDHEIPWLEWLLTRGTEIVIGGFHVTNGQFETSRSGQAVMTKKGSFGVDGEHSGTVSDNFITRAILAVRDPILDIIKTELLRGL